MLSEIEGTFHHSNIKPFVIDHPTDLPYFSGPLDVCTTLEPSN
jgi:hypothetical protein